MSWFYLNGLVGFFAYDIETEIETNANTYTYDGLSGTRVFPSIGFGGGVETPWEFPLRLQIGSKFWLPLGQDTFYEKAIGQLTAGIQYRF